MPLPPECQSLRQSHASAATFPVGIPDSAGTIPLPLPAVESWVRGFPSALVKLKPAHCKVGCLYAYTSLSGQESDSVRPHLEGLMGPSQHLAEDPQMSLDRLITGKRLTSGVLSGSHSWTLSLLLECASTLLIIAHAAPPRVHSSIVSVVHSRRSQPRA